MHALISKMEALLLGSKDCLVEFGQILNVDRLLAALVLIEAELVDETAYTLDLLARSNVSQKVAYSIDSLAIRRADGCTSHLSIKTPERFPVGSKRARFLCAFQMSTVLSVFELETVIEKPMNVAGRHVADCVFGVLPLGQRIRLISFNLTKAAEKLA